MINTDIIVPRLVEYLKKKLDRQNEDALEIPDYSQMNISEIHMTHVEVMDSYKTDIKIESADEPTVENCIIKIMFLIDASFK